MKLQFLLFLATSFMTLNGCTQSAPIKVILLAGQSNMEGHDATFADHLSADKIETYRNNNSNVKIKYDCYYQLREEIGYPNSSNGAFVNVDFGQGRDEQCFGPEVGLAHYLGINDPNQKYVLIKSCEGSSDIGKNWSQYGHCYRNFINDVDNGITVLKNNRANFKITAFVWMQGEADSFNETSARAYKDNMLDLMNRITTKYSEYLPSDGISLIDGGISTISGKCTYADIVNQAKKDVANTNPKYHYVADSETLALMNDWHYTADNYLILGEKFAEAYLSK